MKRNKKLILACSMLSALALQAEVVKNINGWNTWKRPENSGREIRIAPNDEFENGVLKFVPEEGATAPFCIQGYFDDPVKPDQVKKYKATIVCSEDLNQGGSIFMTLRYKDKNKNWKEVFRKQLSTNENALVGKTQYLVLEIDMKPLGLEEDGYLCPIVYATGITSGSVSIIGMDVETSTSTWEKAAHSVPGVPGMTVRENAFKLFSWPAPIPVEKFDNMLNFTAAGLNILDLKPEYGKVVIQWVDGATITMQYADDSWSVSDGKGRSFTVKGDVVPMAADGTGVVFKNADGSCIRMEGGLCNDGMALLLPEGIETPAIKQKYILPQALLWCSVDEAEQVLKRSMKLFNEQIDFINESWKPVANERNWREKMNFYAETLAKMKARIEAETDGFLSVLVADPILRDKFNWLVYMAVNQYSEQGGYFGGEFRNMYFEYLSGRGEIAAATDCARKIERLVAKSRRVTGANIKENLSYEDRLSAGWTTPLETVPKMAGLPAKLDKEMKLRALRGEKEAAQLVLSTAANKVDAIGISYEAEDGAPILSFDKIAYTSLCETAAPQMPLSYGSEVQQPDVCVPMKDGEKFAIDGYSNQPILVTAKVAADTVPGTYNYKVNVSVAGNTAITLPISVTVEELALGKRLRNLAGFRYSNMSGWYGNENFQRSSRNMMKCLMDFRLEPLDLYGTTPAETDLEWALENGLEAYNLGGSLNMFSYPRPTMCKYVKAMVSNDGETYKQVDATVKLVTRDESDFLSEQDLVVEFNESIKDYKYCKIHYSETRGWYDRDGYSYIQLNPGSGILEIKLADGSTKAQNDVMKLQPDKSPFKKTTEPVKITSGFAFDNLRDGSNLGSIIFEKGEDDIKSVRLINNMISVAYSSIKRYYDKIRKVTGPDFNLYVYSFDEVPEHINPQILSAVKRFKQAFPDVQIVTTAANMYADPEIFKYVDHPCPSNAYALPRLDRSVCEQNGIEYFTYVGGGGYYPFGNFERVDQPLINSRAFFWEMIAFEHIKGFLYWDIHMWRNNTKLKDMHPMDWSLWNPLHGDNNGMGALFYPGEDCQIYPSLRATSIRDGIEDVETFNIARAMLKEKPNAELQAELQSIGDGFARSMSVFCHEPADVYALRNRLFELIKKLQK